MFVVIISYSVWFFRIIVENLINPMILLIVFFVFSILFSFLCSVLEAVLLSITPSFIRGLQKTKPQLSQTLQEYKKDIDKPLSAILTLNTLAHTAGAIGVGASVEGAFGHNAEIDFGLFKMGAEPLVAGLMTLAILILSEIIPKTWGANNWKRLTPFTVATLRFLMFALYPLVWVSQLITKSLKNEKNRSVLSRADFAAMTEEGAKTGALDQSESAIINNLLRFEHLKVRKIMTPKSVMLMAKEDMTLRAFYSKHHPIQFSRIPVYQKDKDDITGVMLKDDLLQNLTEDKDDILVKDIKREVAIVNENMELATLFAQQTEKRQHLNIVTDEFGAVVGIVTLEDIFETLLGKEIVDEFDKVVDMQELAKKKWEEQNKQNK